MKKFLQLMAARESNPWTKYNQQGLVFQLDCQKGCTADTWTDLKGGVEYSGNDVTLNGCVPYFNGTSSKYSTSTRVVAEKSEYTIEVVIKLDSDASRLGTVFCTNSKEDLCFESNILARIFFLHSQPGSIKVTLQTNELLVLSFNISNLVKNEESIEYNSEAYYSSSSSNTIGYGSDSKYFKGKIYAIRIYDRLLTAEEMIANQEIDLARFKDM